MALNKAIALLLVLTVAMAPLASALVAPLNANTNVRCCGTGDAGGCVDTGGCQAWLLPDACMCPRMTILISHPGCAAAS